MTSARLVRLREQLVTRGRWRSRRAKARLVRAAMARWGHCDRLLLIGAGQGWTDLDTVVERAAAGGASFVAATDLHQVTRVPWPYVRADARRLPFGPGSFDVALSNAVIEHVGDEDDQRRFVAEHLRVAPRAIITTPNRWFPLETHTRALFRHWSPAWRAGQSHEFTRLLSRREFRALLPPGSVVFGRPWSSTLLAVVEEPS